MTTQERYTRSVWIPPMDWKKVVTAAAEATIAEGERVTAADIVRRALEAYLKEQM